MHWLHFSRRLHLYLALSLFPWFLMYGVSSFFFNHGDYFDRLEKNKGLPNWKPRFEKTYELAIPDRASLREVGARIMRDNGLEGTFGTYRQGPNQVNVYIYSFWRSTQVKYFIAEKKLIAEDMRFRWDYFFTGMHAKGGFEQDGFFNFLWSTIVDLVCLGLLLWVATGMIMWSKLPATRGWGWIALITGAGSFLVFLNIS